MAKKSNKNSRKKSGKNSQASIQDEKNLSERVKYFLVLLLILFLGIIFYLAYVNLVLFPRNPVNSTLNSSQECNVDGDCVKVQTTCCPCSMGGTEVCVPEEQADEYRVNKSECPENQFCTAMYNCNEDPCVCEQGNCDFSNSSE